MSYTPIAGSAIGSGDCSSDCCPDTSCSNTGGGCDNAPLGLAQEDGKYTYRWWGGARRCNDYCAAYNNTYGMTAGGCTTGNGCYRCEECINGDCKRYEDSCQCAGERPSACVSCGSNGLWVPDPLCGIKLFEEKCLCVRKDNYCAVTYEISRDCASGAPNPDQNTISSKGWILVGVTGDTGDGVCSYKYCSNGSGDPTDECYSNTTGKKCCPGQEEQCVCTHTPKTTGTGEKIYGDGRWCIAADTPVTPPSNYELYFTNEETGEKCYKEYLGISTDQPGSTECKNSCTGEECDCCNCHCHSDCPPGYQCDGGNCIPPPSPSPSPA